MPTLGLADIIGPVMVGPSSSHTAGALRIASTARRLCAAPPVSVEFKLYGSFAHTYRGHGTDRALMAGVLGLAADDERVRDSLDLARQAGLDFAFTPLPDEPVEHPNTVDIVFQGAEGPALVVRGVSVGGGAAKIVRINGIDVEVTGENSSVIVAHRDTPGVIAHVANALAMHGANIAGMRSYRERRGDRAFAVVEVDGSFPEGVRDEIAAHEAVFAVRVIPAADDTPAAREVDLGAIERFREFDFASGQALLAYCEREGCGIADAFRAREAALAASTGRADGTQAYLERVLQVMRASALGPVGAPPRTMGGLIGGEAHAVATMQGAGGGVCTGVLGRAATYALAVLETNASMGRIVAAPTAGSSGVIPAVLLALADEHGFSDEQLQEALLVAAAVGQLIARNATVSGAEGGCQAEIGAASAMAAAAAAYLAGAGPRTCLDAASNAIANMLGLVCDPIAGLVEAPCQKRNAAGAATALVSAEVALAGVGNLVGFDESVEALYKVGRALPFELRETALGGMAATPSACRWCESFRAQG